MPRNLVQGNLVRNGGFETFPTFSSATSTSNRWIDGSTGSTATLSAYRWAIISGTTSGTFAAQFDNTYSHSGSRSMKLSTSATASALEVGPVTSISVANLTRCAIPVSGSTSYTGTYWMKTEYTSGDATDGAYIDFHERSAAAGSAVANFGVSASGASKVKTTTDWALYTITFTTASTTRFILPRMAVKGTLGTGTLIMSAWFDDIFFYPTATISRTAVS